MENYLYLLELFVETVTFSSNLPEYPKPYEVVVSGEMGQQTKMEVFTVHNSPSANEAHKDITLNSGRSTLFSSNPDKLLQKITENPFVINVYVKQKPMGHAEIGWTKDFFSLVKQAPDHSGMIGPASMHDQFLLKEEATQRIMGDITATVKLSSFGSSIQTSFQMISSEKDVNKKFLVKGARGETTFECQKMGEGSVGDLIPMTPLVSGANDVPSTQAQQLLTSQMDDDHLSWMALFKSTMDPKFSVPPDDFNIAISNIFGNKTASALTFDIVSLMERPEENKYIDLRIRGGSRGFVFEFEPDSTPKESKVAEESESLPEEELTIDKINKMLCKSKDCPAAKKFKEFGIGPLANTRGLGTIMGETSLPLTYGLSQTYGVFDEYGPYGLFSKPKRPSNPFIPKQDNDWAASCWKPKRRRKDRSTKPNEDICNCQKHACNACYCQQSPLRLTGGGVLDHDDLKSPFYECKEIMDQFDEVLAKYKKALGPCGKTTCPFAPNIVKESCKKMCRHEDDVYSHDGTEHFTVNDNEEHSSSKKKFNLKGACGSPKCAYAKYKTGLADEDAEMELQYLPQAPSGKCGHPKCPFPVEPDLPPIHWDCPDPLPKGRCKNPECPYLPKEIKCLNAVMAKGMCGNFNCPYSPPPPCSSPTCPFGNKECPYQQKQTDSESFCGNTDCPFAPKKESDLCDNPDCPFAPKKTDICNNPTCPYAVPPCPQPPPCYPPPCGNAFPPCYVPPCGDALPPCYMPPCGASPCPYGTNPLQALLAYYALATGNTDLYQVCFGGSECPYMQTASQPEQVCAPQPCPNTPRAETKVCSQPEPQICQKKPSPCYVPMESACGNPNCPWATRVEAKVPAKGSSRRNRGAEEGAELKEGDVEYRSDTRLSIDLAPCNPNTCKSKGGELICDVCPCSIGPSGKVAKNNVCENPVCPYAAPKTCYIKPPPCYVPKENEDVCDNPECPYASKPCAMPPCAPPSCYPPPCGGPPCPMSPPSCPMGTPPCPMAAPPCPYLLNNYLQSLLASCIPLSICPNGTCPYPAQDLLKICLGGPECPFVKPPAQQPRIVEATSAKDDDVCENPTCPYAQKAGAAAGSVAGAGDTCSRKDQQSAKDEVFPSDVEYTSGSRTDVDNQPCYKGTCKSTGGQLACTECPCGADGEGGAENDIEYVSDTRLKTQSDTGPGKKGKIGQKGTKSAPVLGGQKKKRKFKSKYVYSVGDKYPGVQIGHKECVMPAFNVPPKMGWLWNVHVPCLQLKPRRGWRPGAIARTIAETIRQHRQAQGLQMLELKDFRKGKKGYGTYESGTSINIAPKPTLHIKKHEGCYYITMNPLKDPYTLAENESPYMDCTPMQFKIVKNKDKCNKPTENENDEYRSCFCGEDENTLVESSSSDSELEIEFTPPAGIIHPERFKRKRNVVHCDTQYLPTDFETKTEGKSEKGSKKGKKGKDKKGKKEKGKKGGKKGKKK